MVALRRTWARPIHSTCFVLFTSSLLSAASLTVTPTVTTVGNLYHYSYSITNNTPDDPFLIDIPVPNNKSAVANLVAPAGFMAAFDSGLGLVSFLEDSSMFSSVPQSGFSFDSPDPAGTVNFQATVLSSTSASLYTISGQTLAPVPEPALLLPAGLLASISLLFWKRKRNRIPVTGNRSSVF